MGRAICVRRVPAGPDLALHAALRPVDGGERQMLLEALDALQPHSDLPALDRGYFGYMMVATSAQRGIPSAHAPMQAPGSAPTRVRVAARPSAL